MVFEKIQHLIQTVERQEQVRILLAVESGSRAWGFPSRDSDYDVRFIYIHPKDWYLSINVDVRRDVIERPLEDLIDASGWDIRKALRLFAKANPPLIEWLSSPVVYRDQAGFREELLGLLPTYYQPRSCMYHYLRMAENSRRDYLEGTVVWTKKYLYVLRPILAVKWIEQARGPVPMEFKTLLAAVEDRAELIREIRRLIERKQNGEELDRGPSIPVISVFISEEMDRLSTAFMKKEPDPVDLQPLQSLFAKWLAVDL
jgi:predicted nucleotidyltransferase